MISAYIFLQGSAETGFESLSDLRAVEGVKQAHIIMGPNDAVAYVEVPDMDALARTVTAIRSSSGVLSTDTRLAWPF